MRNIWVLCGGPSTEYEVSLSSARVVCHNISLRDQRVRPAVILKDSTWLISERELAAGATDRGWLDEFFATALHARGGIRISAALASMLDEPVDCAFLALHGQYGEDGRLQGFLEAAGIPYTGSGVLASAVCFNKRLTLQIYEDAGLSIPQGVTVGGPDSSKAAELSLPVFVKPSEGGSSVGMSLVHLPEQLDAAIALALETSTEAIVEERVDGIEVSCGVLDLLRDGQVSPTAMPPTEILPAASEFFDYEAKYTAGKSREITPANLPADVTRRVQECARAAHIALGCEGMSRTDMIVPADGEPRLLETNTIPGLAPTSLLPQQFVHYGITFPEFIDGLIDNALLRAKTPRG